MGKLTHTYLYRASVGLGPGNSSIPNGDAGNVPGGSRLQVPGPCIQVQQVQSDRLSAVLVVSTPSFHFFSPRHTWPCVCTQLFSAERTEGICRKTGVDSRHLEEISVSFICFLKPRVSLAEILSWDGKRDFFFSAASIKDLQTQLKVKV